VPGEQQQFGFKMAVDFCDYFWGEKHDGFQARFSLYLNFPAKLFKNNLLKF
jgi:hypothetical protein